VSFVRNMLGATAAVSPLVVAGILFSSVPKHPANDDWIYGRTTVAVANYLRGDEPPKWTAHNGQVPAAAVTPIAIAGVWSAVSEFSWDKLHLVSQLLAGIGVVSTFVLVRRFSGSFVASLAVSWTLLLCPWFWSQSFTFMTDASATGFAAAAAACWAIGIVDERNRWLLFGGLFLALAVFTRQTTLAFVAAPATALLFGSPRKPKQFLLCVTAPFFALAMLETGWFGPTSAERTAFVVQRPGAMEAVKQTAYAAYGMLLVVGFSLAPLALLVASTVTWTRRTLACTAIFSVPAFFFTLLGGRAVLTSATGPTLQNAHFGPILLSDCFEPGRWGDLGGVEWPFAFWTIATLASFVSLAVLAAAAENSIAELLKDRADRNAACEAGLIVTCAGAGTVLLLLMGFHFDRYWLAAVAPFISWAAMRIGRFDRKLAKSGLIWAAANLIGLFALNLVFTHDWLAFNDARWKLVEKLQVQGFRPEEIDGGYEVNGWFRSAEDSLTRPRPGGEQARWWNERAVRFLAVGSRPGMVEVDRIEWFSWAVRRPIAVLVLRREPEPSPKPP
jgi:4-amino-4-deoxy-L-arabinose transferase-like glycosyltransferase